IRFSQTETDRHTQDSLEAVHSALGHVVDRLAMIEGGVRAVRSAPPQPALPTAPPPAPVEPPVEVERFAMPEPRPELPNPAAAQPPFGPARGEFRAAEPTDEAAPQDTTEATAPPPPLAISEILVPHTAAPLTALEPDLPPDHPLEPGTRPGGRIASPS